MGQQRALPPSVRPKGESVAPLFCFGPSFTPSGGTPQLVFPPGQRKTKGQRTSPLFIVCCPKGAKKRTGGEQQQSCCPLRGANLKGKTIGGQLPITIKFPLPFVSSFFIPSVLPLRGNDTPFGQPEGNKAKPRGQELPLCFALVRFAVAFALWAIVAPKGQNRRG